MNTLVLRTEILKLKSELKSLAQEIRELKSKRKEYKGYVSGLAGIQNEFRYKHIAYCLLRGRTLDQIENKLRDPNDPNHAYCRKAAAKIVTSVMEKANEQTLCDRAD